MFLLLRKQSNDLALTVHSRQIRPPIYSLKQSKLRKRRVIRYAILYFAMFFLFFILVVGPVIINKVHILDDVGFSSILPAGFVQPTGWNNNDTNAQVTGKNNTGGAAASGGAGGGGGGGISSAPAAQSSSLFGLNPPGRRAAFMA